LNLIKPLRRIDHMALPQQDFVRNIRKRHKQSFPQTTLRPQANAC
jgi:hypothetical protein